MNYWQTRLQWVQQNRGPCADPGVKSTGTLILEFARSLGDPYGPVLQAVTAQLADVVDAEFAQTCRLQIRTAGVLSVQVGEVACLALLRRKWQSALANAVAKLGIRQVVFEPGNAGVRVAQRTIRSDQE